MGTRRVVQWVAAWVLVPAMVLSLASCSHHRSVAGTYVAKAAGLEIALTLKDDGTWTGEIGGGQGGGTYTVSGDTLVLRQTGSTVVQRATIEGDRLVLHHGAVSLTFVKRSPGPPAPSTPATATSATATSAAGTSGTG